MIDFGGLGDLLGGAGDVIQDPLASIEGVLPVDGLTDAVSGITDQISEAGSGATDSVGSLLP